jgi:hypothetical protein
MHVLQRVHCNIPQEQVPVSQVFAVTQAPLPSRMLVAEGCKGEAVVTLGVDVPVAVAFAREIDPFRVPEFIPHKIQPCLPWTRGK